MQIRSLTLNLLAIAILLAITASTAISGTYVVDSKGKFVGPYSYALLVSPVFDQSQQFAGETANASVTIKINGLWFQLPISEQGFAPFAFEFDFDNAADGQITPLRWVSIPKWRRASWSVTSMVQRRTNHSTI
jgi:hypothetical protein